MSTELFEDAVDSNNDSQTLRSGGCDDDRVYAEPRLEVPDFRFDDRVARCFDDMIRRSVPGYDLSLQSIATLTQRYFQPGSTVVDLGASLGASTLALIQGIGGREGRVLAVDNSAAMVAHLRENVSGYDGLDIAVRETDIMKTDIADASVVVLNYTLQFIEPEHRLSLMSRIAEGLRPGGILILSEKVVFDDREEESLLTEWHHDFKRYNGYSDLEIEQKRAAIENVLIPDSLEAHRTRLLEAGFARVVVWSQAFRFASLVAMRG